MRELSDIEIKPGQSNEFKPGGDHVINTLFSQRRMGVSIFEGATR